MAKLQSYFDAIELIKNQKLNCKLAFDSYMHLSNFYKVPTDEEISFLLNLMHEQDCDKELIYETFEMMLINHKLNENTIPLLRQVCLKYNLNDIIETINEAEHLKIKKTITPEQRENILRGLISKWKISINQLKFIQTVYSLKEKYKNREENAYKYILYPISCFLLYNIGEKRVEYIITKEWDFNNDTKEITHRTNRDVTFTIIQFESILDKLQQKGILMTREFKNNVPRFIFNTRRLNTLLK